MSFDWPIALVALLLVPALVALYVIRERRRTAFASGFTNPDLLPNVVDRKPGVRRHVPLILLLLGPMRRSASSARRQRSCSPSTSLAQ